MTADTASALAIPAPVFLGFCLKASPCPPPDWGEDWWPANVREICSVSDCIAERPPEWVDRWDFNRASCWNDAATAMDCVSPGERDAYRLYAYHAIPMVFDDTDEPHEFARDELFLEGLPPMPPEPDLSGYDFLGYDVAEHQTSLRILGFGCSPLSCNGMAAGYPVNACCLLDTLEDAVQAARTFGIEQPEPGPFIILAVRRKRETGQNAPSDG